MQVSHLDSGSGACGTEVKRQTQNSINRLINILSELSNKLSTRPRHSVIRSLFCGN